MKLVLIDWIDARGSDGWVSEQSLLQEKPTHHHSVGFVIKDTPEFITVTMSWNDERDNMGAWLTIPKVFIKKIKKL